MKSCSANCVWGGDRLTESFTTVICQKSEIARLGTLPSVHNHGIANETSAGAAAKPSANPSMIVNTRRDLLD